MEGKKKTFRIGLCRRCRNLFIKLAPKQLDCDECSYWRKYEGGKVMKALFAVEDHLKKEADLSGNPKVWTAEEYSQEFLRSLIART